MSLSLPGMAIQCNDNATRIECRLLRGTDHCPSLHTPTQYVCPNNQPDSIHAHESSRVAGDNHSASTVSMELFATNIPSIRAQAMAVA